MSVIGPLHLNQNFDGTPSGDLGSSTNPYTSYAIFKADFAANIYPNLEHGDRVEVQTYGGTIREKFNGSNFKTNGIDLVFLRPDDGPLVISGSDVFTDWTLFAGSVYRTPWPYEFFTGYPAWNPDNKTIKNWYYGNNPLNTYRAEYLTRYEGVWWDGRRLKQVLESSEIADEESCFWVDQDGGYLYVKLPGGEDPSNHLMEVLVRDRCVEFTDMARIELRGVALKHAQQGAELRRCWYPMLRFASIFENTHQGWVIEAFTNNLIRKMGLYNVNTYRNGFSGGKLSFSLEHEIACCDIDDNNLRGAVVKAANWQEGAIKFYGVKNGTQTNVRYRGNHCTGPWWDRNCSHDHLSNCEIRYNNGAGIFWEISGLHGPLEIEDTTIENNGWNRDGSDNVTGGIHLNSSKSLYLLGSGNVIRNNGGGQIYVANSGRTTEEWETSDDETEPIVVSDIVLNDPRLVQAESLQETVQFADFLTGTAQQRWFWKNAIDIGPDKLAVQVVPQDRQLDYLETHPELQGKLPRD